MTLKKMTWYKHAIIKTLKKEVRSLKLILVIIFPLTSLFWYKYAGKPFEWEWIDPIAAPPYVRLFYSALVFITLGFLLYLIKFYQVLYIIFVKVLGDFRSYKGAKSFICFGLIALMYFKIVPWFVDVLNIIISIGYNLLKLIVYFSPVIGISLVLGIIISLFYIRFKEKSRK